MYYSQVAYKDPTDIPEYNIQYVENCFQKIISMTNAYISHTKQYLPFNFVFLFASMFFKYNVFFILSQILVF